MVSTGLLTYACKYDTYELLVLPTVLYTDVGLATLVEDGEGEVLDIGLNLGVAELASDETLRVEDGVVGVHGDLVLGGITNQTLGVGEGNEGWGGPVALVVGDDLNAIVLPDTDARVGGAQVDANSFCGHYGDSLGVCVNFVSSFCRKRLQMSKQTHLDERRQGRERERDGCKCKKFVEGAVEDGRGYIRNGVL